MPLSKCVFKSMCHLIQRSPDGYQREPERFVTEVLINHLFLTCLLENDIVRWVYVVLWKRSEALLQSAVAFYLNFGLLFKCAGQNPNIQSVRMWQAGMQDNFRDLLIHRGSKQKKKGQSVRRAEVQMRCGRGGDLGMWADCRADEGSGNRCVAECISQVTWTGGKVGICGPC